MKVRPASDYNRSVANALVLRGKGAASVPIDSLNEGAMYPKWLPANQRLQVYTNSRPFSGYEKSASLLTNSQISIDTIDKLVLKAWNMFTSKAYVHQYEKHGLTSEDFLDCFTILESVICDYQRLSITWHMVWNCCWKKVVLIFWHLASGYSCMAHMKRRSQWQMVSWPVPIITSAWK